MVSRDELDAHEEEERILFYKEQDRQRGVAAANRARERASTIRMYILLFSTGAIAWLLFAWLT